MPHLHITKETNEGHNIQCITRLLNYRSQVWQTTGETFALSPPNSPVMGLKYYINYGSNYNYICSTYKLLLINNGSERVCFLDLYLYL